MLPAEILGLADRLWAPLALIAGTAPGTDDGVEAVVEVWRAAWGTRPHAGGLLERHLVATAVARASAEEGRTSPRVGGAVDERLFLPHGDRWEGWWREDRDPGLFERFRSPGHASSRVAAASAVAGLPLAHRVAVVLVDVACWPPAEVHAALGIRDADRQDLLHEARAHVRRALEQLAGVGHVGGSATPPAAFEPSADYDISCRDLTALTTAYLDGALPPRSRVTFEEHLVICAPCRAHLDEVEVTRQVLLSLAATALPVDARDAIAAVGS